MGLNEHHQNEVINYMRFARSKRGLRLKTVDSCFQDLKESRYQRILRKVSGNMDPSGSQCEEAVKEAIQTIARVIMISYSLRAAT